MQVGWRGVGVRSEREDLQDGSESRSDVWAGDAALTRRGAGGREMFVVSHEDIKGTAQVGVWREARLAWLTHELLPGRRGRPQRMTTWMQFSQVTKDDARNRMIRTQMTCCCNLEQVHSFAVSEH